MRDLTVIIPLHEYNKDVEALLTTAVESLKNADKNEECNTIIVSPLESIKLPDFGLKNLKIVKSEKGDFCTQINTAVNECKTKYFSILEYDDVYTEKWFDNVQNNHLKITLTHYITLIQKVKTKFSQTFHIK